jgi:archaellum component FlaG (FlaF/FlaG flagellin family)
MSFSYNPLKHVEIVDDPPNEMYSETQDPNTYAIYCHGCGNSQMRVSKLAPIAEVFERIKEHVRISHTSKHFDGWSVY